MVIFNPIFPQISYRLICFIPYSLYGIKHIVSIVILPLSLCLSSLKHIQYFVSQYDQSAKYDHNGSKSHCTGCGSRSSCSADFAWRFNRVVLYHIRSPFYIRFTPRLRVKKCGCSTLILRPKSGLIKLPQERAHHFMACPINKPLFCCLIVILKFGPQFSYFFLLLKSSSILAFQALLIFLLTRKSPMLSHMTSKFIATPAESA